KEQKTKVQKAAEFSSAFFKLMRVAGFVQFEHALQSGSMSMQKGAEEFWSALGKGNFGEALQQGGENWVMNAKRLLSIVGLSENPEQAMRNLSAEQRYEKGTTEFKATHEDYLQKISEGKRMEELQELATVRKGEGITHTFVRQLEHDPGVYGFKGNAENQVEVHRWAQREAYGLAVKNGYIKPETGEEVRVYFDEKNPSAYLLKPDGSAEVLNKHEYHWNPQLDAKAEISRVFGGDIATAAEIQGAKQMESDVRHIYGVFLGKRRMDEWEIARKLQVQDALEGDFGKPVGGKLDLGEVHNREQMQEYIKDLQEKSRLAFKRNETVEEYLRRVNTRFMAEEITRELDGTKATEEAVKVIYEGQKYEWDEVKKVAVADAAKGEFGEPVRGTLDMAEDRHRTEIKKLINDLHERTKLDFKKGETVEEYLKRANQAVSGGLKFEKPELAETAAKTVEKVGQIHTEKIAVDNVSRIIFQYDAKGNIINHKTEAPYDFLEMKKLFNKDWLATLMETGGKRITFAKMEVENEANKLVFLKKVLAKLAKQGKVESPEAKYLGGQIKELVTLVEKKYGDIFK
ncbi:MAG: hypothetical protein AAB906_02955, partial [Patescibacteria group bacterium]